jgi:S1-C subfamily serine protease
MSSSTLATLSNELADAVDRAAVFVVQVQGRRQPASGVVYAADVVVTTMRALGREDGLHIRTPDGRTFDAELAGWDPATHLAVLRAPGLDTGPATVATSPARVGHIALAVARSWSNVLTASHGIVAVIGGPLRTGRGREIDQVIRTTAPMHSGFAGGAFVDTGGQLIGIATAAEIRGLGVIIPASIAWKAADDVLRHGKLKRGYLGVAGQAVRLSDRQRDAAGADQGLLIVGLVAGSPAESAGLLVGDIVISFDGEAIAAPERLLDLLVGDRVGRSVPVRVLRGGAAQDIAVTVGERSAGS